MTAPAQSSRRASLRALVHLVLVNAAVAWAVMLTMVPLGTTGVALRSHLFAALLAGSQSLLLAGAIGLATALLAARRTRPRAAVVFAAIGFAGLQLLLLTDRQVFAIYRFHLNRAVFDFFRGGDAWAILDFSWVTWLTIAGILIAIALVEIVLTVTALRVTRPPRRATWVVVAAILVVPHGWHIWADVRSDTAILTAVEAVPWAYPATAKRFLRRWGLATEERGAGTVRAVGNLRYPRAPLTCAPPSPPLHLVIVVVDSLRGDMLAPDTMPFVARLADESWVATEHHSTSSSTRHGLFSLMYGLVGDYWEPMLRAQRGSVLVSEFLRAGYMPQIWGSAPLSNPEFDRTIFADVRDRLGPRPQQSTTWARDRFITDGFLRQLTAPTAPLFGFLFYDAPHGYSFPPGAPLRFQPSAPGINYAALNNDFDPLPIFNRYRNSVVFVDGEIRRLVGGLQDRGYWDRTVLVITGDHGQEFNEDHNNLWGHNGAFSRYQVHVPLLVRIPGEEPRRITSVTTHLDVTPTLLRRVLGCTNPVADYSNGRDLIDPEPRRVIPYRAWTRYGVGYDDRVAVYEEAGGARVYDAHYRPVDEAPDSAALRQWMEWRAQFAGP